jgi:hypothetical protein
VYMRALYWEVYRLLPSLTTYRATIHMCSPCCNSLYKAKSRSCDSDRCTVMARPERSSQRHFRLNSESLPAGNIPDWDWSQVVSLGMLSKTSWPFLRVYAHYLIIETWRRSLFERHQGYAC